MENKYYERGENKSKTLNEIEMEFYELKNNTNEFNRFTFNGFLKKYYRKKKWS
jgi:hypothetical protein